VTGRGRWPAARASAHLGGNALKYFLKTDRGTPARETDAETGKTILDRGRYEGRRVVEVFVRQPGGEIDRYLERTRRKLGSNAISSRTWLCETYEADRAAPWGNDRYVPNPEEAIQEAEPSPEAVMLVLTGAEGDSDANVAQLSGLGAPRS